MFGIETSVSLPVSIINPKNNKVFRGHGMIDTGASNCCFPSHVAMILGLPLMKGKEQSTSTGDGSSKGFRHVVSVNIYHPEHPNKKAIHSIEKTQINFMPNLPIIILGVNEFLKKYTLCIDYPKKIFSLTR